MAATFSVIIPVVNLKCLGNATDQMTPVTKKLLVLITVADQVFLMAVVGLVYQLVDSAVLPHSPDILLGRETLGRFILTSSLLAGWSVLMAVLATYQWVWPKVVMIKKWIRHAANSCFALVFTPLVVGTFLFGFGYISPHVSTGQERVLLITKVCGQEIDPPLSVTAHTWQRSDMSREMGKQPWNEVSICESDPSLGKL